MLAVVEHNENSLSSQELDEVLQRIRWGAGDPERDGKRALDQRRIRKRGQIHEIDPIVELFDQPLYDAECDRGFANSARANNGHQSLRFQTGGNFCNDVVAADGA